MLFKRIRDIMEHKSGLKSIIMEPAPVGKPLKVKSTFLAELVHRKDRS